MGRFPVQRSAGNCNRAPRRSTRAAPRPAQEWEPAGSLRSERAWCCWRRVRGGSCAPGTTAQVLLVRTAAVALPGTAADPPVTTTAALLAVVPTEVGYAAGWWVALQRGVAAVMIIGVEEGGELCEALGFAGVGARVGPFLFQGAVEPLDLAVGLGPVGAGAF